MDRIAMLTEILAQNSADAFARYGLAMEYSKAGEVERALEERRSPKTTSASSAAVIA